MTGTGPDDDFLSLRADILRRTDLGEFGERPWDNWPVEYVRRELSRSTILWNSRRPMGMTGLPPEAMTAPEGLRVAWLLGRASIDGLDPAGLHP